MTNIVEFPEQPLVRRKRCEREIKKLAARLKKEESFNDIRTEKDALCLKDSDPFRYAKFQALFG